MWVCNLEGSWIEFIEVRELRGRDQVSQYDVDLMLRCIENCSGEIFNTEIHRNPNECNFIIGDLFVSVNCIEMSLNIGMVDRTTILLPDNGDLLHESITKFRSILWQ